MSLTVLYNQVTMATEKESFEEFSLHPYRLSNYVNPDWLQQPESMKEDVTERSHLAIFPV